MSENSHQPPDMATWMDRLSRAEQTPFPDVSTVSSPPVKCLIAHYAQLTGCREESLFVPMLTCCAREYSLA